MTARKKTTPQGRFQAQFASLTAESARATIPMPRFGGILMRAWEWIQDRISAKASSKRLQVTASVPLGEKRFVAVLKVDGREFLVGGGAGSVALLAPLVEQKTEFAGLLEQSVERSVARPKSKLRKQTTQVADKPVVAVKKSLQKATSKAFPKKAGKILKPLQWSAQLQVAPSLGHFIKPELKSSTSKTKVRVAKAKPKAGSKTKK